MGQKYILGLEIAMYDLFAPQKNQAIEHLFGETPNQLQRKALEVMRFDELVEVHPKQLRGDAEMAAEVEALYKIDSAEPTFRILISEVSASRRGYMCFLTHSLKRLRMLTSTRAC